MGWRKLQDPSYYVQRFWSRVERTDSCWLWTGGVDSSGYGQIRVNGRVVMCHRFAYELANGSIAPGLLVLHHCDTPRCVRPDHLFTGTQLENIADRDAKGRTAKGERCATSKLTRLAVRTIRQEYARGAKQASLARTYGVSAHVINGIVHNRYWREG